jgi:hypothetical protein
VPIARIKREEEERLYEWAIGGHLNNSNEEGKVNRESLIWVGWSFPPSILVELPKKLKRGKNTVRTATESVGNLGRTYVTFSLSLSNSGSTLLCHY